MIIDYSLIELKIDIDDEGLSAIDILSSDSVTSEFLIDNSSSPIVLLLSSEKNCCTADRGGRSKSANKPNTGDEERRSGGTKGGTFITLADDVEKVVELREVEVIVVVVGRI